VAEAVGVKGDGKAAARRALAKTLRIWLLQFQHHKSNLEEVKLGSQWKDTRIISPRRSRTDIGFLIPCFPSWK